MDVACKSLDVFYCLYLLIYIFFCSECKGVRHGRRSARVCYDVSLKVHLFPIPFPPQSALVLTKFRAGTRGNTPRYRVRSRSSRARCTRLPACGTTGLFVPRTRATSWVWGLLSLRASGPRARERGEARHGMGTRRALECLGCKSNEDICCCTIYAIYMLMYVRYTPSVPLSLRYREMVLQIGQVPE